MCIHPPLEISPPHSSGTPTSSAATWVNQPSAAPLQESGPLRSPAVKHWQEPVQRTFAILIKGKTYQANILFNIYTYHWTQVTKTAMDSPWASFLYEMYRSVLSVSVMILQILSFKHCDRVGSEVLVMPVGEFWYPKTKDICLLSSCQLVMKFQGKNFKSNYGNIPTFIKSSQIQPNKQSHGQLATPGLPQISETSGEQTGAQCQCQDMLP